VEDAIGTVIDEADLHSPDALEWMALKAEPTRLREMLKEVGEKPAGQRRAISSIVIGTAATRERVEIPPEILEKLEAVYEWYRRVNLTA